MISEIKNNHTSICYMCENARKPASDENRNKGYVGCCIRCYDKDHWEINNAKEIAEGWVDLRASIECEKGSGLITNYQLLTLEVTSCDSFMSKDENFMKKTIIPSF